MVTTTTPAADLERLATTARAARTALYDAVAVAVRDHGISEREAAARTALNRATVRKILGKP